VRKKKTDNVKNFLDFIPKRVDAIEYHQDEDENVVLHIERKSFFDKIAQKLKKTPRISYYTLDSIGSFVWLAIDGKKTIYQIGEELKKEKGDSVEPLYERLAKYFQILELNLLVSFEKPN